jgi:hypothetical protein
MLSRPLLLALLAAVCAALLTSSIAAAEEGQSHGVSGRVANADPFQGIVPEEDDDFIDPVSPETVREFVAPAAAHPHVLFLAENSCTMRKKFKGARAFLRDTVPFIENIHVRLVGGYPRVVFFQSKADLLNYVVDSRTLTTKDMLERLANLRKDPTYYDPKEGVVEVPFSSETTASDISALFDRFKIGRHFSPQAGVVPVINEDDDDRPGNKPFSLEEMLKDSEAPVPTEEQLAAAAIEFAKFVEEKAKKDAEEAAEAERLHAERDAEEEAAAATAPLLGAEKTEL